MPSSKKKILAATLGPLVWLAQRRWLHHQEQAADELVVTRPRGRVARVAAATAGLLALCLLALCLLTSYRLSIRSALAAPPPTSAQSAIERHFSAKKLRGCFLLADVKQRRLLAEYGGARCRRALAPCSTFKLPNSMFGLDAGVLKDLETRFAWDGRKRRFKAWNRDHTLKTAFRDSVVWYYRRVARGVGRERMQRFLRRTHYGSRRLPTGAKLTEFWLNGSLTVTAHQQLALLRALYTDTLAVSPAARRLGRTLMRQQVSADGTVFGGKTGTCMSRAGKLTDGWFIGHLKRSGQDYVFVTLIEAPDQAWGRRARQLSRAILKTLKLL